jgi:hypothetical protein
MTERGLAIGEATGRSAPSHDARESLFRVHSSAHRVALCEQGAPPASRRARVLSLVRSAFQEQRRRVPRPARARRRGVRKDRRHDGARTRDRRSDGAFRAIARRARIAFSCALQCAPCCPVRARSAARIAARTRAVVRSCGSITPYQYALSRGVPAKTGAGAVHVRKEKRPAVLGAGVARSGGMRWNGQPELRPPWRRA